MYTAVVVVGEKSVGFGAKVDYDFSVDGLTNEQILEKITAKDPDVYAASMPDGTLYETEIGTRRLQGGDPVVRDWVAKWDESHADFLGDSLKTARQCVASVLEKRILSESVN